MNRILIVLADTDVDDIGTVEELILAKSELATIDNGYQDLSLDTPEWVTDKLMEVNAQINARVAGELKRRLRAATARREALQTNAEKRKTLDAEIADLQKRLA